MNQISSIHDALARWLGVFPMDVALNLRYRTGCAIIHIHI